MREETAYGRGDEMMNLVKLIYLVNMLITFLILKELLKVPKKCLC